MLSTIYISCIQVFNVFLTSLRKTVRMRKLTITLIVSLLEARITNAVVGLICIHAVRVWCACVQTLVFAFVDI